MNSSLYSSRYLRIWLGIDIVKMLTVFEITIMPTVMTTKTKTTTKTKPSISTTKIKMMMRRGL